MSAVNVSLVSLTLSQCVRKLSGPQHHRNPNDSKSMRCVPVSTNPHFAALSVSMISP
jgi:hypothetical protein